jgi:glycosyltransferase involved in cell wall biosynthesis
MNGRLAVFNCHEPWVYQLRALGRPLDIITDLPGRHARCWDESLRPILPNTRIVSLASAQQSAQHYDCVIAHNLTDLLDAKNIHGPRLLVIHLTLEGMVLEQRAHTSATEFRAAVQRYIRDTATHVVAVSSLKGASWGFAKDLVPLSADPSDYPSWQGDLAQGLRVSNFVLRRARTLMWDFHQRAFAGLPVTLVGHNPEIPGVRASHNWPELKDILRRHRFFIHTAAPDLEDGYNMATLEAMAAGLPILGNVHPTSPVEHGVSGFLSDDSEALRAHAEALLRDRELAATMGRAARLRVQQLFSPSSFRLAMLQAIEKARQIHQGACPAAPAALPIPD